MAASFKVKCFSVVAIAVHLSLILVPYVISAPVLGPKMMNATKKMPKVNSVTTTTIAPVKLLATESGSLRQLSPFQELLSIINNGNHTEPPNKDSLSEELNNTTQIANAGNPSRKAKDETTRAFKQNPKQTSSLLKTQPLAPSNLKAKGVNAANSSREPGETSAVAPGYTPSSRNKAGSQKPQSIVDTTFTAIPTNKTVGKHSNTSEAVTQRATLSDVVLYTN